MTVLIYYWDDRDGSSFSGWWIGPKVGGDQVWSHADNRTSKRQRRFKRAVFLLMKPWQCWIHVSISQTYKIHENPYSGHNFIFKTMVGDQSKCEPNPQVFLISNLSHPENPQAKQSSRSSPTPPPAGWHVPWDGPVDPSLTRLGRDGKTKGRDGKT